MVIVRERSEMKKAVIVIELVDESEEASNEEVRAEIVEKLESEYAVIPWMKNVETVTVIESRE